MIIQQDNLSVIGTPTFILFDKFGAIKQQFTQPNLVVTVGKNLIADRLIGTSSAVMSHMAVGSSSTAPANGNTALGAQISTRVALSSPTRSNSTITYITTFVAGQSTGAIVEAGIFNASTAGIMLCRTTFPVINKEADDILTINWNVTIN
jgi:hypothetical protein